MEKNQNGYTCHLCSRKFSLRKNLKRHLPLHNPDRRKEFQCKLCKRRYFTAEDLKGHHRRIHRGKSQFPCHLCNRILKSETELEEHKSLPDYLNGHSISIFNKQNTGKAICNAESRHCIFCGKSTFRNTSDFTTHTLLHTKECPYFCNLCPFESSSSASLRRHLLGHNLSRPRNFTCHVCKKAYFTAAQLKDHARIHATERAFKCNICDKELKRKNSIVYHLKTHEEAAYTCNICEKRFTYFGNLNRHIKSHTGESRGQFHCHLCQKKFSAASSLKIHVNTVHNSKRKRNFVCGLCRKGFFTAYELKVHHSSLTHSGSGQVQCELCSKLFSSVNNLNAHLKRIHNSKKQTT